MKFNLFNLLFLFVLIFGCQQNSNLTDVNKTNIVEKINNAYLGTEKDEYKSLIPILLYIEENNIVFKDNCLNAKLQYLKLSKAYSIVDNESQKKYNELAVESTLACNDYELISKLYNAHGVLNFSVFKDIDKAIYYYKTSIETAKKLDSYGFAVDAYYGLASSYLKKKNWEKAKEVSTEGIAVINKFQEKKTRLKYLHLFLAEAYISLGKQSLATNNIDKAKAIADTLTAKGNLEDYYKINSLIDRTKSIYYEKNNDKDLALSYLKSSDSLNDLRVKEFNGQISDLVGLEYTTREKLYTANKELLKKQKLLIYLGVFSFLILLVFFWRLRIFSKIQKENFEKTAELNLKLEENNKNLKKKNNSIKHLLNQNETLLLSKTLKMSALKDAIGNISKNLEKLSEEKETVDSSQLLFFNKALNEIISETELWEDFKLEFEKNYPSFFEKLLSKAPNLSITEQKHCAYLFVNMSAKEVASLINLSPRSVETARYRIKKKLNTGNLNLLEYLKSI